MYISDIEMNRNYFYMPFGPTVLDEKELGFEKTDDSNIFTDASGQTKWRVCRLYDTGWGKPKGFERLPELSFDDLIKLALFSECQKDDFPVFDKQANKFGAISVILERHTKELISFLNNNIGNMILEMESVKKNLLLVCLECSHKNPDCLIIISQIKRLLCGK